MAQRTVMGLRSVIGAMVLLAAPGLAVAQEQVGPEDLTRSTADPVEKLVGLWRVDSIDERLSSDALKGRVLRIDRQSVTTLTLGTCTNPSFVEQLGSITVNCLGQGLATVAWNPEVPGTIEWSERDLRFVLRRISGTEALDSPPAAEDEAPVEEGESEEAQ
jgi:hypothetical protein